MDCLRSFANNDGGWQNTFSKGFARRRYYIPYGAPPVIARGAQKEISTDSPSVLWRDRRYGLALAEERQHHNKLQRSGSRDSLQQQRVTAPTS